MAEKEVLLRQQPSGNGSGAMTTFVQFDAPAAQPFRGADLTAALQGLQSTASTSPVTSAGRGRQRRRRQRQRQQQRQEQEQELLQRLQRQEQELQQLNASRAEQLWLVEVSKEISQRGEQMELDAEKDPVLCV